ncbi:glycoside hydrolase family 15 protein [Pedobacter terrae]|uniref:glycoside hydrolase family 15 protein n=1 Tax=Pedobacter terrae TaxID=405671 RepID=UPI002FF9CF3A
MTAAATTSLPEVIGGERNYDYWYVWMRDAALITDANHHQWGTGREVHHFCIRCYGKKRGRPHTTCSGTLTLFWRLG